MKTITKPYKIIYHVFADNFDEWTGTLGEANRVYKDLNIQGYRNIRIYKETYETENDYKNTMVCEEDYVRGIGEFPW